MEKEQKKLDLLQQCMKPKGAISTMMSNVKVLSSSLLQANVLLYLWSLMAKSWMPAKEVWTTIGSKEPG